MLMITIVCLIHVDIIVHLTPNHGRENWDTKGGCKKEQAYEPIAYYKSSKQISELNQYLVYFKCTQMCPVIKLTIVSA